MTATLNERAKAGIRVLLAQKKFSQRELAKAVRLPASVINRIINKDQPVTLRILEAVGSLANINPVELLVDTRDTLKTVSPPEAQLLRFFRGWPAPTREALLSFASFFADEDPVTADERRAHEQIRRLGDGKRRLAYAYLTFLTEGDLPPDIRRGLGLPEKDAPQSPPPQKAKRKAPPKGRT